MSAPGQPRIVRAGSVSDGHPVADASGSDRKFRSFSITLGWSPAFRRFSAENRLKAGLQPRMTQSY